MAWSFYGCPPAGARASVAPVLPVWPKIPGVSAQTAQILWLGFPGQGWEGSRDDGWLCVTVAVLQMLSAIELPAVI